VKIVASSFDYWLNESCFILKVCVHKFASIQNIAFVLIFE
jgi:hypothetical protein